MPESKKIEKRGKTYYKCTECGLLYKEKEWADKCRDWCEKNHTCNIEITKHSIKSDSFRY